MHKVKPGDLEDRDGSGFGRAYIALHCEPGTDEEDAQRLARQLRESISGLDITGSVTLLTQTAPDGAKSGMVSATGEMIVTLSASGGVLVTLIGLLRDWLGRRSAGHRISITIGGDTLELEGSTLAERERLIQAFVAAHTGNG
jgi:hypothetical protein